MLKERKIEKLDWDQKGKCVGGYLLDVLRSRFKDGSFGTTYIVQRTDSSRVIFKGSTMLNFALGPSDKGLFIQVEYLGEDESKEVSQGFNRPKLFKVSVDDERSMTPVTTDPSEITDADIPF